MALVVALAQGWLDRMSELRMPNAGEFMRPMLGMEMTRNPLNGFVVVRTHYTADHYRRGTWAARAAPKYGGMKSWRWRREMEIDWHARSGKLVFENFNPDLHRVKPRTLPAHWPRWIMVDPGWNNPMSILWVAVDTDTVPDADGFLPVHVYREFYKPKHTPSMAAIICRDWSRTGRLDHRLQDELEWVQAIVIDPMAKQEHQGAQDGETPSDQAETFLTKFEAKLAELGWDVPVELGNNMKDAATDEIITRLGNCWMLNGLALMAEDHSFRDPTLDELVEGAEKIPPTLYIHAGCADLVSEMGKYRFREWAAGDVAERHNEQERPIDKDDHSITNLIRFFNLMRENREEGEPDLSAFEPRHKPRLFIPTDADVLERQHSGLPHRYRQRLVGRT